MCISPGNLDLGILCPSSPSPRYPYFSPKDSPSALRVIGRGWTKHGTGSRRSESWSGPSLTSYGFVNGEVAEQNTMSSGARLTSLSVWLHNLLLMYLGQITELLLSIVLVYKLGMIIAPTA